MTAYHHEDFDPEQLARELNRCRQHPLADLDLNLHGKPRVPDEDIAHLTDLARAYCAAIGVTGLTRQAAILRLLTDGLAAYATRVDVQDSAFVKGFFFDQSPAADMLAPVDQHADSPAPGPPRDVLKTGRGGGLKALAKALGVSEKRLAEMRDAAFIRFTTFLLTFVASVSQELPAAEVREVIAAPVPLATPPPPPRHSRSRRRWIGAGLAGLVVASSLFVAFLLTSHRGPVHTPTVGAATTAATTTRPYQPDKTYPEVVGAFGAPTFADPYGPSGQAPKIPPNMPVQVACKVLAPSIPSVSPDGYWYLIASPPWSDHDYAAANTFMNGDHVGQTTPLHNTDFAVPDCPAQ